MRGRTGLDTANGASRKQRPLPSTPHPTSLCEATFSLKGRRKIGQVEPLSPPPSTTALEFLKGATACSTWADILKCGVYGTFPHVSEAHLGRHLTEFDFRYFNRRRSV